VLRHVSRFNPHPSRRTGATTIPRACALPSWRFNPHPSRRTGATCARSAIAQPALVSILTRPEGRVQLDKPGNNRSLASFQSSPVPKDGCNCDAFEAEAFRRIVSILTRPEGRVQRMPKRGSVATWEVSILTRPEGRVQRKGSVEKCSERVVSILTRPEGRVQLQYSQEYWDAELFQSSPVPKDGCNPVLATCM